MYYKYKNYHKMSMQLDLTAMASLWELGPVIFGPTEDFILWLQGKGLLADSRICSSCSGVDAAWEER